MVLIIKENESGMTVKEYFYKVMKLSSAAVKRVKYRPSGITVNGESVTVRRVLKCGDTLELAMEDRTEDENAYTVPRELPLKIAYEDGWLTVVDKPARMPAHPSLGHKDDTVANALAYRYRGEPFVFRPVNRLDCDTSGLMLAARGKIASGRLYKSMISGEIKKAYVAVLEGELCSDGLIETFMCREGGSIVKRRVCAESDDGAKAAVTKYEVMKVGNGFTVVRAYPVTGRTHQLRVHFSYIGHPIYGDTMYGNPSEFISRQALHASFLRFPHPENGESVSIFSPLPSDIRELIKKLSER